MSLLDDVHEIIDASRTTADAASKIYRGPKALALYVIETGLEHIRARRRATKRREFKVVIQPEFRPGRTTGSFVLTPRAKARLVDHARELFVGWEINATIRMGEATKEELLFEAKKLRASAKGNIRTAQFYEALAEPLKAGQRVRDYWRDENVVQKIKDEIWTIRKSAPPRWCECL